MFGIQSETSLLISCEKFIVCQPKSGGVIRLGAAPEQQKIAPCIDQIANQN